MFDCLLSFLTSTSHLYKTQIIVCFCSVSEPCSMKGIFCQSATVHQYISHTNGNMHVDNKDQAVMGFTSLRTRDMTNHDYTQVVYSRPSEAAYRYIIRGKGREREKLLSPDIRVEPNICITVCQIRGGTIIAWHSHNQRAHRQQGIMGADWG